MSSRVTRALAVSVAFMAGACATNPPAASGVDEQAGDGHATAGAVFGGATGAAVGAVGGTVIGALGAVGLCAPLGPFAVLCAPAGAVVGAVGGAVSLGKKGAEWGAQAAQRKAPDEPAAATSSDLVAQIGSAPESEGGTARYFAARSARDPSTDERPPEAPLNLQYIGQFEAQGGLPYHKYGKMFLDTTSVRDIDPAKGEREPSRTADFVVNYWSQEAGRLQSYAARAAVDCASLRLRMDRWDEHAELFARGSAFEEHPLNPPTIIEGDPGDPDSTVTKGVKAACANVPPALAAARIGADAASDALPAAGTVWTYRFSDQQYGRYRTEFTVHVLRRGSTVGEEIDGAEVPRWQRQVSPGEARVLRYPLRADAELIEFAPYYSGNAVIPPVSIPGYPAGLLSPWVVRIGGQRREQITVPAGSFSAWRVELAGKRSRSDYYVPGRSGRFEILVWYAPAVKRFVRLEHKTWEIGSQKQIGHDVVELLSYQPPT